MLSGGQKRRRKETKKKTCVQRHTDGTLNQNDKQMELNEKFFVSQTTMMMLLGVSFQLSRIRTHTHTPNPTYTRTTFRYGIKTTIDIIEMNPSIFARCLFFYASMFIHYHHECVSFVLFTSCVCFFFFALGMPWSSSFGFFMCALASFFGFVIVNQWST